MEIKTSLLAPWLVGTVRLEDPGQVIVGPAQVEDLLEPALGFRILDREQGFDPPIEVAGHQVGRAYVVQEPAFRSSAPEDAGMFQEPATMDRTVMFSLSPGTPGRRLHTPRTIRSIRVPAWEAS